jgi:hypothetical protein
VFETSKRVDVSWSLVLGALIGGPLATAPTTAAKPTRASIPNKIRNMVNFVHYMSKLLGKHLEWVGCASQTDACVDVVDLSPSSCVCSTGCAPDCTTSTPDQLVLHHHVAVMQSIAILQERNMHFKLLCDFLSAYLISIRYQPSVG